jgi:hypothetical protein
MTENVQNIEYRGVSASSTPEGGGWLVLGLGGEGGVSFNILLGREKIGGGDSLREAEAGEVIIKRDGGGKRPRRNEASHHCPGCLHDQHGKR